MKRSLVVSHGSWVVGHSVRRSGSWVKSRTLFAKSHIAYRKACCILHFTFYILHFTLTATAQTTLQVVTKTIEKTYNTAHITGLEVLAERADVEVMVWAKPEVKIIVELTSKHPDRATATTDLENLKYGIEQIGKTLFCRNYLMMPKGTTKPQANLKVRFVVLMPANCAIKVQNSFGKIQIKGMSKETTVNTEFCSSDLVNMTGAITINTHFGELRLTDIDGQIVLTADHSDTWLKEIKGQCDIKAQSGSIDINTDKAALKLKLKTDKTEVRYAQALVTGH